MDVLVDELRAARGASAAHAASDAEAVEGALAAVDRVTARAMMSRSHAPQHRFQSFWYGGPLSPYELFCLRSFIDWGHAVDLYSYDTKLAVPAGVRVCDAAELIPQDEVFVYQAEGFGKGSPSAFSNYFRYKLLAEKGGWWIDTDVVCLGDRIRIDDEFFARQDADFIAPGTMYFEPRHPVMLQCLEQTMKLGRNVKWGDTGPRLFTHTLAERGWLGEPRHLRSVIPFIIPRHWKSCARRGRPTWPPGSSQPCFSTSGIQRSSIAASTRRTVLQRDRCCARSPTGIRWMDGSATTTRSPSNVLSS
jgi:hypothetical protein